MTKLEKLCKKLPEPFLLYVLADWFDVDDAKKGNDNNEVQQDLRQWAGTISAINEELEK